MTIAAQVIQPNAQACPVVEVRQTTFSRERLRELTERFCPGAELYHYWQPTQRELLDSAPRCSSMAMAARMRRSS